MKGDYAVGRGGLQRITHRDTLSSQTFIYCHRIIMFKLILFHNHFHAFFFFTSLLV